MSKSKAVMIGIVALLAGHASAQPDRAGAFTVTDALGRVVHFTHPPQQMVTAGKASFMIANAVNLFPGARERMQVFSRGMATRPDAGSILALIEPGHASANPQTGDASVEQIASAHPDAVLLKSSEERLGRTLGTMGIPVVYLDFETPAQYERDVQVLGRLLKAEERAQVLLSYYRNMQASVQSRIQNLPATRKPRVLFLQYSERGGIVAFSVPPPKWIQTELVKLAGGIPVWEQAAQQGGWSIVNLEQIAAWNPDIVLVASYTASAQQAVTLILTDTKWQSLRAAQSGRIYAFPGDVHSWDQPDTRWGLGLLWLATRIHPDLFRDINLPEEVIRFYALYGLTAATVQSRILPLIQEAIGHVPE